MNKKLSIKKLINISAIALAMISACGVASTVNANTNVHADSVSAEDIGLNKGDLAKSASDEDYATTMQPSQIHLF